MKGYYSESQDSTRVVAQKKKKTFQQCRLSRTWVVLSYELWHEKQFLLMHDKAFIYLGPPNLNELKVRMIAID